MILGKVIFRPHSHFKCRLLSFFVRGNKYVGAVLAYLLYTGIGTIGAVVLGVFIHREKISTRKAPLLFLIISSAVMLKLI